MIVVGWDIQQLGLWIIGFCWPILPAPQGWAKGHELALARFALHDILRASGLHIDAFEDILFHKGLGRDKSNLVFAALQQPQVPVAPGGGPGF